MAGMTGVSTNGNEFLLRHSLHEKQTSWREPLKPPWGSCSLLQLHLMGVRQSLQQLTNALHATALS